MKHNQVSRSNWEDFQIHKRFTRFALQSTSTMYDAELKTEEEFNCILIYNEETKVELHI